jgi:hypothetical protein
VWVLSWGPAAELDQWFFDIRAAMAVWSCHSVFGVQDDIPDVRGFVTHSAEVGRLSQQRQDGWVVCPHRGPAYSDAAGPGAVCFGVPHRRRAIRNGAALMGRRTHLVLLVPYSQDENGCPHILEPNWLARLLNSSRPRLDA